MAYHASVVVMSKFSNLSNTDKPNTIKEIKDIIIKELTTSYSDYIFH